MRQIVQAIQTAIAHLKAQQLQTDPALPDYKQIGSHLKQLRHFTSRLHWHDHFIQKLESDPSVELGNLHPFYDTIRATPNQEFLDRFEA